MTSERSGTTTRPVPIPVLHLEGAPRERGAAHGEQARELVQDHLGRFRDWAARASGQEPQRFIDALVSETRFTRNLESASPDLVEECRGIADGAGIGFQEAFALQLLDEAWWVAQRMRSATSSAHHCTSVGWRSPTDDSAGVAQTMDLPDYFDGLALLLRLRSPNEEAYVLTAAGMIGLTGVNSHGVGICCNSLPQLDHRDDGVPVAFIVRQVLQRPSAASAQAHLRRITHASGQNYMVSGPDLLFDIECSANSTELLCPQRDGVVFHTNHPLVNTDTGIYQARSATEDRAAADGEVSSTGRRYEFMERNLSTAESVGVGVAEILLTSTETPVCIPNRRDGSSMTLATVIMESLPTPLLHISDNPATAHAFTTHAF